jgi:hypothetical protein
VEFLEDELKRLSLSIEVIDEVSSSFKDFMHFGSSKVKLADIISDDEIRGSLTNLLNSDVVKEVKEIFIATIQELIRLHGKYFGDLKKSGVLRKLQIPANANFAQMCKSQQMWFYIM